MKAYEQELSASTETVLREADALYSGWGRLQKTLERLAARLGKEGVAFELVGGYAVFLHGLRRFTEDIDLLVRPEDLDTLRNALIGAGYVAVSGSSRAIRDAETGVRIDFVLSGEFPGDGKPKPVAFPEPRRTTGKSGGIAVVDLRTLLELKLASGMTGARRLQDLADVQRLIEVHGLKKNFAKKLHPYVRDRFIELCGGK